VGGQQPKIAFKSVLRSSRCDLLSVFSRRRVVLAATSYDSLVDACLATGLVDFFICGIQFHVLKIIHDGSVEDV
jgi:hypothetical protein